MGVLAFHPVITLRINASFFLRELPFWVLPRKYDSHTARHMQPPTPLWNIDPLFIELARPVTLCSAQTFIQPATPSNPLSAHWHSQDSQEGEGVRLCELRKSRRPNPSGSRSQKTARQRATDTANSFNDFDGHLRACSEEITRTESLTNGTWLTLKQMGPPVQHWRLLLEDWSLDMTLIGPYSNRQLGDWRERRRVWRTYTTALSKTRIAFLKL